jgi:hypothetical protein
MATTHTGADIEAKQIRMQFTEMPVPKGGIYEIFCSLFNLENYR